MSLKDLLADDLLSVFLNVDEFADMTKIELEGVAYTIPAVVSKDESLPFGKMFDGVYQCDVTLAFRVVDVARKPVKGQELFLNDKPYLITNVSDEKGLLIVKMEVPDVL